MNCKQLESEVKHLAYLYEHNYMTWYELFEQMCKLKEKIEKETGEK